MRNPPFYARCMLTKITLALCAITCSLAWAGPVVGLVYTGKQYERLEHGIKDDLRDCRRAIEENGGEVRDIGQSFEQSALDQAMESLDALLLPGGIDVDPKFYGEQRHEKLEETDAALDVLEFKLLDYATAHALPVLGICRGLQVMNVYFGGSLIQDIPSHFDGNPQVIHRYPPGAKARKEHDVHIVSETMLHSVFDARKISVNTYHHQAVGRLAPGFTVSARTDDGIVEGIERTGTPFVIGVQFHPEKMRAVDSRFNLLFVKFLEAARKTPNRTATCSTR